MQHEYIYVSLYVYKYPFPRIYHPHLFVSMPQKANYSMVSRGAMGGGVIPRRCNCENISKDCFCIGIIFADQITEEPVDLSVFSPACLPHIGQNTNAGDGHIYGNYDTK